MKIRVILPLFLFALLTLPAQAQDGYRLRVPTAEEYLELAPQIGALDDVYLVYLPLRVLKNELEQAGDFSSAPFSTLYPAYRFLSQPFDGYVSVSDIDQQVGQWVKWVVLAWLRDNHIVLGEVEQFSFEDFTINVTPADFDGDGQNEWVLDISANGYDGFWMVATDPTAPSGYRRVEPTIFAFSYYCAWRGFCGGTGEILGIQDVNSDGKSELLISSAMALYGFHLVSLSVLTMQDGGIVNLVGQDGPSEMMISGPDLLVVPPEGTWVFENLDDDTALEFVETESVNGSIDCFFQRRRVYDWNPDEYRYIGGEVATTYDDSSGCALRFAHQALWDGDYETAIRKYERALALMPHEQNSEINQYVRLRLASAYAINGQDEQAATLLDELAGQPAATTLMDTMISLAYAGYHDTHNPVALCTAMYNTVGEYGWSDTESGIQYFGQINDYSISTSYIGNDFGPATAGCDLQGLLYAHVRSLATGEQSPADQLSALGWQVEEVFQSEWNGSTLWIVWTAELPDMALILVPTATGYNPSREYFAPPDDESVLTVLYLPSGDTAEDQPYLVHLFNDYEYSCPHPEQAETLELYTVVDDSLSRREYTLCDRQSLDEIFTVTPAFTTWVYPRDVDSHCRGKDRIPVTFTWNAAEQRFVPEALSCTEDASLMEQALFTCGWSGEQFCGFYTEGEEALIFIDTVLADPPESVDEAFWQAVHYHRALTLEALNRPDEALAEYVAIYEAAPESAWGMLAALHFEKVE